MKIAPDLIGVLLAKDVVCLDRPSYIGQAVLDLSKLRMYQLQYHDLQRYRDEFSCEINIVAGDTDSFFLECKGVNLRSTLLPKMIKDKMLDTSNYPKTHPLYNKDLDSVIGKFKDESKGHPFFEWIFLRPKCYSLLGGYEDKTKAKGVRINKIDPEIKHADYLEVYTEECTNSIPQQRFGMVKHQLFTMANTKVALKLLGDMRFWCETSYV